MSMAAIIYNNVSGVHIQGRLRKEKISNSTLTTMLFHNTIQVFPKILKAVKVNMLNSVIRKLEVVIGKIVPIRLIMIPPVDW
jgi:hypothetical protein